MATAHLALAVLLLGCSSHKRPPDKQNKQTSTDSDENQAMLRKLQGYIDCLTEHSARVFQLAGRYGERAATAPATAEPRPITDAVADPARCQKAIAEARALRPAVPALEAAGDAFATAIGHVFRLTTAAQARHRDGQGSGDPVHAPAQGAALDAELVAAFHDFDAAQAALFDQVVHENRAVHVDQVARREKRDGTTLAVRSERVMIAAEDLVRFAATPWNHLDRLDLTAFTAVLDALDRDVADMAAQAVAYPEKVGSVGGFSTYLDDARAYVIAGKQLALRARDRLAYSDSDKIRIAVGDEASVVGSPAALARAYDRLVQDFARQ